MASYITKEDKKNIAHIFTDKYYELCDLSNEYVLYLVITVLKKSNITSLIRHEFVSIEKIIQHLVFIPEAEVVISWLFNYLREHGFLEIKQVNNVSYFKISKDLPNINPKNIIDRMLEIDQNVLPSNLLLERAATGYLDFFLGNRTAIEILFAADKMKLWNEYFNNNNSGYVVYNCLSTLGLLKWLPQKKGIKILEIGGGTGSASVYFLKEIYNRSLFSRIEKYIFSDISPILLRVGNRAIMAALPDNKMIQLQTLDFNKSFICQDIRPDSLDIIYGVNAIHTARNLIGTLENIYCVLRPGGSIVLSECVRPRKDGLLFQEFIFNLLDNYRDVEISELRPLPGFLDVESWKEIFRRTKFKDIQILTNTDCDNRANSLSDKKVFAMIIRGKK
jgi:SAM-dependent methyltransferase